MIDDKDSFDDHMENQNLGKEVSESKRNTLQKIINILKSDPELKTMFCFNKFTNDIEHYHDNHLLSHMAKRGSSVSDIDISCLRSYLSQYHNIAPTKSNLDDAVLHVAINKSYHPIKDYLSALRWDGQHRLDRWLIDICGAEDNPYTQAVGRKLFVAAVKRIFEPGCYYAQLVILEGKQRIYKSRLVKAIGQDWYASIQLKTHDTKQVVEDMRGKWILEIEELAGFNKQDTEHMKAFVSRQSDRVRLSYGRRSTDFPRQSIMIATMNPDNGENRYLIDNTGNVRYWPIRCDDSRNIDVDTFIEIRDQLFAEAFVLYEKGETLWLDSEEQEIQAVEEQENRMARDPWSNIIKDWLEDQERSLTPKVFTSKDIAIECLELSKERVTTDACRRIARIMALVGWKRKRTTIGSNREWCYTPPEKSEVSDKVDWNA